MTDGTASQFGEEAWASVLKTLIGFEIIPSVSRVFETLMDEI